MLDRRPLARIASLLGALLLLAAALAPAALADGDPASDVLLGENVFYPYTPPVSASLQKALNAETSSLQSAKYSLKVALIASAVDLGVIPDLFNKPQQYAKFLDQEISFQGKQRLLVVMPSGYGVEGLTPAAAAAVAALPKPAGTTSNALAAAAITAVRRVADASGHPINGAALASSKASGSGSGSSSTSMLLIILAAAAFVVAGALAVLTLRRRGAGARS